MLISISYFSLLIISIIEKQISNIMHVNIAYVILVTFYIRGFVLLSLIHDLAPRFKKTISIIWTMLLSFIYIGIDAKAGDKLFLNTAFFFVLTITYNIILYKKSSNLKSTKGMS